MREYAVMNRFESGFLARKVVVIGPFGDMRFRKDVVYAGLLVPFLDKKSVGDFQKFLFPFFSFFAFHVVSHAFRSF